MHEGAERARLLENSRGKRERGALETSAKLAVIGAVACPPPRDNRLVRVRIINAAFFSLSLSLSLSLSPSSERLFRPRNALFEGVAFSPRLEPAR